MWPGLPQGPARSSRRTADRDTKGPFLLRWIASIALAMMGAGLVEYAYASHQLEARALDNAMEQHSVYTTDHLKEILADAPGERAGSLGAKLRQDLGEELAEIATAYDARYVALFEADGALVARAGPESVAAAAKSDAGDTSKIRAAATRMQATAEREQRAGDADDDKQHYQFLLPLRTADGTMVLEIEQPSTELDGLLADLRQGKLVGLLISILLAIPLSYLLGGRRLQQRLWTSNQAADTDALTGLAGRRPFRPTLEQTLTGAREHNGSVALALIDIDEFKQVNDRLGHSYGDRVLISLGTSFEVLRASDTAFRLGGDEFAVVLPRSTDDQALDVLELVRANFTEHAPGVTFSCGVASTGGADAVSLQELWERADAALYEAKHRGRRQSVTFSATATALTISVDKLDAVRGLLEPTTVLKVAFQPIWDLEAGAVLGHEALLRLPPDVPLSGPQEAFELAQRLGLGAELDAAARNAVLHNITGRLWTGTLFLNVHPDALRTLNIQTFTADIIAAGLEPHDVVLEVTEQADLDQPEPIRALKQLRAQGFRLAMDDMGHGNAGLRALTHVQFDVIKIDRGVIAHLSIDAAAQATVAAATTFVQRTGGWAIAEGIEDLATLAAVTRNDLGLTGTAPIRGGQGYLLGRPVTHPLPANTRLTAVLPHGPNRLEERQQADAPRPPLPRSSPTTGPRHATPRAMPVHPE